MAVKRKYRLNLRNYGNLPAIMLSQYDEGYALEFELRDGVGAASDLSAYTVTLKGTRADTLAYSFSGTISTNVLTFVIDTTMTACAGKGTAEIAIKDTANDVLFATFNMPVFVERAAVPEGSIDADVERAQEIAEQVQEIVDNAAAAVSGEAEKWATGQIDGTDVPSTDPAYENNAKYYAEQAADAAASIGIDATLTQAGKAADSKKAGDEISSIREDLSKELSRRYTAPFTPEYRVITGGIRASDGGDYNNHPERARTQYIAIEAGKTYFVHLDTTDYKIQQAWIYTTNAVAGSVRSLKTIDQWNYVFTAEENIKYFRMSFSNIADDTAEITEENRTTIRENLYFYTDSDIKTRTGEFIRFTVKDNHRWTDNTSTTTDDAESSEEVDHLCILTLPESYTPTGKKTPLIMYCYGASCGITTNSWYGNSTGEGDGANFLAMVRRFTSEGYAIFDVDNTRHVTSGFNDWGSLPLMSAYIKAWEYVKENYNVESDLYLLSASMGTPVAQNMMKWYKGNIKTALILAPRPFGIKGRWDETYATITDERKKEFLVAWGLEDDAILTDDTFVVPAKSDVFTAAVDARFRGFYHYENMVTINNTNYVFEKYPPMKVMVGLNDTSFLPEVRAFYAALQNFGNYVNYREVTGKSHGAMCTLVGGELLDEGVAWFERFRYMDSEE